MSFEQDTQGVVLVVDDRREIAEGLANGLRSQGFATAWTTEPRKALRLAKDQDFDVAIVDLVMPELGGVELVEELGRVDPRVKCIVLTGHGDVEACTKCFKAGCVGFLLKPFRLDAVRAAIQEAVAAPRRQWPQDVVLRALRRTVGDGGSAASLLQNPLRRPLDEFHDEVVRHYLELASKVCWGAPKAIAALSGLSLGGTYKLLEKHRVAYVRRLKPWKQRKPRDS